MTSAEDFRGVTGRPVSDRASDFSEQTGLFSISGLAQKLPHWESGALRNTFSDCYVCGRIET